MECLQSIPTSHGIPHIALYSNARRIQKLSNPNNPSRKTTSIHSPLFSNFISPLLPLTPSRFSSSSTTVKSAVPENQASVETDEWAMQDFCTFRKDVEVTMERVTEIRRSSGLEKLQEDLAALENKAADSTLWDDQAKAQETLSALTEVKDKIKMLTDFKSQVEDADMIVKLTEEMDSVDAKLVEEAKNTIRDLNKALDSFELTQLLSGPYDKKGAVISITAGAGGTDAQDWADMLLRMYIRWGEKQRYKTRVTEKSMGEEAGIKSATLELEGSYAYGYLSGEKGTHRIVRQSPFNSKGLRQDVSSWSTRSHIYFTRRSASVSIHYRKQNQFRVNERSSLCVFALSSESEKAGVSTTSLDGISVAATTTSEPLELKIRIDVTGAKTQAIFDNVFSKMVADAQPIPGFRRVKGGKTPNIPKDILLQVLGPEKVYKNVIKRIINSSIVDYVEKESLKITKDLSVEQNYDELEAKFEPGTEFSFDAFIHLQEASKEN